MFSCPSGTADDWPGTRLGALFFNLAVTIAVGIHLCLQREEEDDETTPVIAGTEAAECLSSARFMRYTFWPCGRDVLTLQRGELFLEKRRSALFCCCCPWCECKGVEQLPLDDQTTITSGCQPFHVLEIPSAVLGGCVAGLYLHFWPCLWWSCDWGEHDCEGVRGAIWFTTWVVFACVMLCLRPTVLLVSHRQQSVWFAVDDVYATVQKINQAKSGADSGSYQNVST